MIGTRCFDVKKGDALNVDCRSRLVGREFSVGRDDATLAAMLQLEALRIIASDAAMIGEDDERKEVMVNGVRVREDRARRLHRAARGGP